MIHLFLDKIVVAFLAGSRQFPGPENKKAIIAGIDEKLSLKVHSLDI
jgi:hypothetical protein